jgi:hypothetical protein
LDRYFDQAVISVIVSAPKKRDRATGNALAFAGYVASRNGGDPAFSIGAGSYGSATADTVFAVEFDAQKHGVFMK